MKDLENYIRDLVSFSEDEVYSFTSLFHIENFSKKSFFARSGEYASHFAFVRSGVLRAYHSNEKGDEYTKTFFTENRFTGAFSSLITGRKNLINIQCLTDCDLLVADYNKVRAQYDLFPMIERLSRILAEQYFVNKEKREIEMVTLQSNEKYEIFKKDHPGLDQRIPQYYIASYLGITPTQLSRIRSNK